MSGSVDGLLTLPGAGRYGPARALRLAAVAVASSKSHAVAVGAAVWLAWAMGVVRTVVLSGWSLKGVAFMSRRALLRVMGVVAVALTAGVPSAGAADLWTETGRSLTSVDYWQGITFDAATRTFAFDGPAQGLWRTDARLARLGRSQHGHPVDGHE